MLKNKADLRTLLWMVSGTGLFFYLWNMPGFNWLLYILLLYFSVAFSVFAHNHIHVPTWKNKYMNLIHSCWITIFYGFPIFGWIPTHNKNHHRHNNKEPDYTRTYRVSEKNNLWTISIYPTISAMAQQNPVFRYYKGLFRKNRQKFWFCTVQIIAILIWVGVAFILDWKKALIYVIIPQQVSLNTVLVFNYIQHVHADEESDYNHSRNIVGWPLNFFLFNNGYHTIHHLKPSLHWSETPQAHRDIEHLIEPHLNEKYLFWYLLRVYILGLFIPSFRTQSMRLARKEREM
ncbi:MAG: fatty acid desaturase [Bacteroidota bacterium]